MIKLVCDKNGFFNVDFELNGEWRSVKVKAYQSLLEVIRSLGYKGTKKGCDSGDCGSCAVIVDGKSLLSCLIPAVMVHKKKVVTIEGLGDLKDPHPIQKAFVEEGAVQCGYCIPGMIISSKFLLDRIKDPSVEEIKHHLDGNLCRCTGYVSQIKAVRKAAYIINKKNKSR